LHENGDVGVNRGECRAKCSGKGHPSRCGLRDRNARARPAVT
jgi:hypothetical protein